MTDPLLKKVSFNPADLVLFHLDAELIFKLGCYYKEFSEKLKNQKELGENEKIYLINKSYLDNFKEKIDYNENIEYFNDINKEENLQKLEEKLIKYIPSELDNIIDYDLDLIEDLDLEKIEKNYQKGLDIVNRNFMEALDSDFEEKDCNIKYYKEKNNIIIQFSDNSKLFINEKDGKYHAIPSPINKIDTNKQNDTNKKNDTNKQNVTNKQNDTNKQTLRKARTFKLKRTRAKRINEQNS